MFHTDDVVERILAVARRSKMGHSQHVVTSGKLAINLAAKTVEAGGRRVHLTRKEYQMLEVLALRKGTTLSKEVLMSHLYSGVEPPAPKIIDVFICKLRKKLAAATSSDNHIETVWGHGYALRDPASIEAA